MKKETTTTNHFPWDIPHTTLVSTLDRKLCASGKMDLRKEMNKYSLKKSKAGNSERTI